MSLEASLQNAVSGLNVSQSALSTISNNIANVNTPGYTRKVTNLESVVTGGVGSGVEVASVTPVVNQFLVQSLNSASSSAAQYSAVNNLQSQLQDLLGDPSSTTSLSGQLDSLMNGLAGLTDDPTSSTNRINAVNSIQQFGQSLSSLAQQVQTLRGQADQQIQQDITTVNTNLQQIASLNTQIEQQSLTGGDVGDLEDQRAQAVAAISNIIDVRTFSLSNGGIGLSTTSGLTLLDDQPRQLVYSSPNTVTSSTVLPQITVNAVDPTTGAVAATGLPLDGQIQSGELRGLLDMRDSFLPSFAAQLGQLGASVADALNAVHNQNSAVPPPASMTGLNTGLTASDLQGFTGTTTFYTFDANNNVVASATVNFSALPANATIGDVINQVNTALGTSGSLSLNNGVLTFSAGSGASGVAIQDGTPPSDRGGSDFSQYFGLNNLVQTQTQGAPNYDTGLTTASSPDFTGATTLQLVGPNNSVAGQYTLNFDQPPLNAAGTTMSDVLNALNATSALGNFATFSLDSNGALVMSPKPGYSGYQVGTTSDTTNRGGTGVTFSNFFGVGGSYVANAAVNFSVASNIASNPMSLALAQVNPSGTPALSLGDGSGALNLQALALQSVSIPAAGDLAASSTTLTNYVSQIISGAANAAAQAQTQTTDQQALQSELQTRVNSVSGVNLDEELANMVVFQNSYNASARIITTVNQLFQVLMAM
ncbi:MAG TPA: flagellar hook-associated protein FlgK [Candidatus Sulfotelmatobacter sp.]|nr:flagellar hook-associated protein FlgK [Candidatus Sulfotelmatobacter sp.]